MKKRVKRKINIKKLFCFIISIIIIYFSIVYITNIKTKNIIILNNSYYQDDDIIYASNIENYPKFITLNTNKIKKKLKKLDLIEDVVIKKKWDFVLEINIKEKRILYLNKSTNKYKLSTNENISLDESIIVPTLVNHIPEDIEKEFIEVLNEVDYNILTMISEIEYSKTEYDDSRFIFYMNDGNQVYINNIKMNLINKYLTMVSTFDNQKGILYLDSGNYFEIKD